MKIISRSYEVLKTQGFLDFVKKSIEFIYRVSFRRFTPRKGYIIHNKVKIKRKHILDDLFLSVTREPKVEDGVISSHKKVTKEGDKVVIIGGGNGVTAVRAAMIVGKKGKLFIYEGGKYSYEKVKKVVAMNSVGDISKVFNSIVGEGINVYGGEHTDAKRTNPNEIPDCDVLELDCEGAEIDILRELHMRPRAIIAELHPWHFQEDPGFLLELIDEKGYEVVHQFGHEGTPLSKKEFKTLLFRSNNEGERRLESGGKWPVVMAAVHTGA